MAKGNGGGGGGGGARSLLKSGDIVKRSGVTRQMLYMYTTMGLIEEARTTPTGHKLFHENVIARLKLIHDLQAIGYSLRDIQQIFGSRLVK